MSEILQEILHEINPDLAKLTRDVEQLLFVSPRAAVQTTRTMAETLMRQVADMEDMDHAYLNFGEVQKKLYDEDIITETTNTALHFVRQQGNVASHDGSRKIFIRDALTCWEYQHLILTWFIEVYAAPEIEVPEYVEPVPTNTHNSESLLAQIEGLMQAVTQKKPSHVEAAPQKVSRKIFYNEQFIDVPDFLRDAFLLPQRFPKSTTFLIRLNGEQQARIMSELPHQLAGLHHHVKRFKEANDAIFFEELARYIDEEKKRKALIEQYSGEVLFFYKSDFVILTEALGNLALTKENFPGQTSLLNSLHEQGFHHVKDLPKELVLLGKYRNVGETALLNLFNQLKGKGMEFVAPVQGSR